MRVSSFKTGALLAIQSHYRGSDRARRQIQWVSRGRQGRNERLVRGKEGARETCVAWDVCLREKLVGFGVGHRFQVPFVNTAAFPDNLVARCESVVE